MTDQELDVLDELHFVQSFSYLSENLELTEEVLKQTLYELAQKGWIKILQNVDEEILVSDSDYEKSYHTFYYLATKEGLLAFHSTGE
ncbi:transporter [Xanthocytophaga agilis]|uniref:Transporter n=1 Tax=Xanthocytophaga agilis TaxID=3048010 RepID=A0AAE3R8B7_9BACT|nr:transporter [Xanthocytophaga agilis]MDJ1503254.1 transporter [Xanthocytophaga agilis]